MIVVIMGNANLIWHVNVIAIGKVNFVIYEYAIPTVPTMVIASMALAIA
jgi:hypothetical protein